MKNPPDPVSEEQLDRVHGSLIGLALGDALGAHVEFRSYEYLRENPVKELVGGGTWGLQKGQVVLLRHISDKKEIQRGFMKPLCYEKSIHIEKKLIENITIHQAS